MKRIFYIKFLLAFALCSVSAVVVAQRNKTYTKSFASPFVNGVVTTERNHNEGGLCPDENHPHMIDLGLPSGTKWSCCNVGASVPEGFGGYYAWGETEEKDVYRINTYKYAVLDDKNGSILHGDINNRHKYRCLDIGYNICGTKYDVAHVKWGGSWRMPQRWELEELIEKCVKWWKTYNGVNGFLFVGPNRNPIFLPAAGWDRRPYESNGNYWSGANFDGSGDTAESLCFFDHPGKGEGVVFRVSSCLRHYGLSVRPVVGK